MSVAVPLVEHFAHGLDAPICLTWELTYACNLACRHCLSSSGRRDPRELTTDECKSVVDELERMQVFYVNIGGGEPTRTRFLIYQDDSELMRRAADHDFLAKLANAGGGKFHPAEELPHFLQELQKTPLPQGSPKANLWPDWRRQNFSGFLVVFFLLFVGLLSAEWFLRRRWGMV